MLAQTDSSKLFLSSSLIYFKAYLRQIGIIALLLGHTLLNISLVCSLGCTALEGIGDVREVSAFVLCQSIQVLISHLSLWHMSTALNHMTHICHILVLSFFFSILGKSAACGFKITRCLRCCVFILVKVRVKRCMLCLEWKLWGLEVVLRICGSSFHSLGLACKTALSPAQMSFNFAVDAL